MIDGAGAAFHQVVIHMRDGERKRVFPAKGQSLLIIGEYEDERGLKEVNLFLSHNDPETLSRLIANLYKRFPGLQQQVNDERVRMFTPELSGKTFN